MKLMFLSTTVWMVGACLVQPSMSNSINVITRINGQLKYVTIIIGMLVLYCYTMYQSIQEKNNINKCYTIG